MVGSLLALSSRGHSHSRMGGTVPLFGGESQAYASQSAARCKARSRGDMPCIQPLSKRGGRVRSPVETMRVACYTFRFSMKTKPHGGKQSKKKTTGLQIIAHAELPTRYGRFTIYGFKGRGPQEEAVALV